MIYQESNFDHKRAVISIKGEAFGRAPVTISVTLEDEDSPNSAGIVVDAIRAAKILRDTGNVHRATEICAALMKSPPYQMAEENAAELFDTVIRECLENGKSGSDHSL
jgi:myo-inositol-1-phosphate synthase